jgi:DNA-binding protein HU-beta
MNKTELVNAVATSTGMSKSKTKMVVESTLETIFNTVLKDNEKVTLVGFGTFAPRARKERKGHNPRTKEELIIPAQRTGGFKFSKTSVKEAVNG